MKFVTRIFCLTLALHFLSATHAALKVELNNSKVLILKMRENFDVQTELNKILDTPMNFIQSTLGFTYVKDLPPISILHETRNLRIDMLIKHDLLQFIFEKVKEYNDEFQGQRPSTTSGEKLIIDFHQKLLQDLKNYWLENEGVELDDYLYTYMLYNLGLTIGDALRNMAQGKKPFITTYQIEDAPPAVLRTGQIASSRPPIGNPDAKKVSPLSKLKRFFQKLKKAPAPTSGLQGCQ